MAQDLYLSPQSSLTGKKNRLFLNNIGKVNFASDGNFLSCASYCQIQQPWQRMMLRPRWRPQSVGAGSTVQMAQRRWGDWRVDAGWSGCSGHPRWRGDSAVHQSRTRPSPSALSWMQRWSVSGLTSLRRKWKDKKVSLSLPLPSVVWIQKIVVV